MLLLLLPLLVSVRVLAAPADVNATSVTAADTDLFELSIIHLNDFHARFEQVAYGGGACKSGQEESCVGGIARVVAQAKQLLAERPHPLLLNAGDNYQGTLWFTIHGWNVTAEFLNRLPWDAVALGNHEFDNRIEGVIPFIENINAPVVACNIDDSKEPSIQGLYKKSTVVQRGGRNIGIIGTITTTTKDISSAEQLEFVPESQAVAAEGARLKEEEGADIIVVLSHSGIEVDLQLAASDPNVDIIVGGHSHTLMYTGTAPSGETPYYDYPYIVTQPSGRKVAVVQAYCYTMYLGNLAAFFDEDGELVSAKGDPIFLDNSVKPDEETLAALVPWAEDLAEIAQKEVGLSAVLLEQAGGVCYAGECNLGSFVADAMVHSFTTDGSREDGAWTRASLAITNAGGLRAPISPGVVTYNDLMTTLPFGNTVDLLEVRGAGLRRALEQAVTSSLQVSGIHVKYYKDPIDEQKIHSIEVLCHKCTVPKYEPLDDDEWYPVAINNFLAAGGDGFYVFEEEGRNHEEGLLDAEVVQIYLTAQQPVVQGRDGRIAFVDKECSGANSLLSPPAGKIALALLTVSLVFLGWKE